MTVSTDQQSWIILSGIAISRYSEASLALFPAYDGNGNVTELVDAIGVRQAGGEGRGRLYDGVWDVAPAKPKNAFWAAACCAAGSAATAGGG